MKYISLSLLLMLALIQSAYAYQTKVEIVEQFDDLKVIAFISKHNITNSPDWNPESEAPPLSVKDAIGALKNSGVKNTIKEIEIRPIKHFKNKWHYLIKTNNNKMSSKVSTHVILMNGIVVPAIIEPQGYK